jgi:hypothetical protein
MDRDRTLAQDHAHATACTSNKYLSESELKNAKGISVYFILIIRPSMVLFL